MTTTVTMLQTRQGEGGSLWTVGNSYAASDAFATVLINSNYATGTLPKSRGLVPVNAQTDSNGQITALVDAGGNSFDVKSLAPSMATRARASNKAIANHCYSFAPLMGDWGVDAPAGGIYYDSNYVGGGSDGSIDRPYTTIHTSVFSTPGQIINLKYGSVFLATSEQWFSVRVMADDVTIRAYGDSSLDLPVLMGAQSFSTFTASGSEYRKTLTLALSHSHFYVAYADNPWQPLQLGSAVGSLSSGQYIVSGGYLYVKDDPGTRAMLVSVCQTVLLCDNDRLKIDRVAFVGSTNNTVGLYKVPALSTPTQSPWLRDCVVGFSGNNGVQIGDAANGCKHAILIRHADVGSRNNGVYGIGDDSPAYIIEPRCVGVKRVATDTYGYLNDGVTAHGAAGLEPWYVVGGEFYNMKEDAIDIIGVTGGGTLHANSVLAFNRVDTCGESGIYAWGQNPKVYGNYITNTNWSGIQIGETTPVSGSFGGVVAFNFTRECGKTANSCGVNFGWNGIRVCNNTFVRSANSTRSAIGNLNLTTLNSGYIQRNLFVLEIDAAILQFSSSNAALAKLFNFKDNIYVIPAGNAVLPFTTGGSPRTFALWKSDDIERSALSLATLAAGSIGSDYKPVIGSVLQLAGVFPMSIDAQGKRISNGVGCYAAP